MLHTTCRATTSFLTCVQSYVLQQYNQIKNGYYTGECAPCKEIHAELATHSVHNRVQVILMRQPRIISRHAVDLSRAKSQSVCLAKIEERLPCETGLAEKRLPPPSASVHSVECGSALVTLRKVLKTWAYKNKYLVSGHPTDRIICSDRKNFFQHCAECTNAVLVRGVRDRRRAVRPVLRSPRALHAPHVQVLVYNHVVHVHVQCTCTGTCTRR